MGNPERYEQERDDASEADIVGGLADPQIREEVLEALATHADLDMSAVEVYVRCGRVTLGGVVDSRNAKRAATETAERCAGVIAVRNEVRVEIDGDLGDLSGAEWDGIDRRSGGRGSSPGRKDWTS